MKTKQFNDAPVFSALQDLSVVIQTGTPAQIHDAIVTAKSNPLFASIAWQRMLTKLVGTINGAVSFKVFRLDGNSKLPFVAFSTLPGVTCPGAGNCLDFCYSYRAWRYPSAFGRQAQNTMLMRFYPDTIKNALQTVTETKKFITGFDLRLYVDGDFSSNEDVSFWFDLLKQFPQIRCYGYSKSFNEILSYTGALPSNYVLNISGGHNSDNATVQRVKQLSITRGEFIAVSIGRKVKGSEHGLSQTNKELRSVFIERAFPCPGTCGSCTTKAHACGSMKFKDLPIIIAMH